MCNCSNMREWVDGDNSAPPFRHMEQIGIKTDKWCVLKKCTDCNQLWQVDESDGKSPIGICIKIADENTWNNFDDMLFRMRRLTVRHGGFGDETCAFEGCEKKALKDFAFCPFCAITRMKISG